jgi:enediyne biosynthesis protein E4
MKSEPPDKHSQPSPHDPHEELVSADDTIIGRAFHWSLLALLALAAIGVILFFAFRKKPVPLAPQVTELSIPVAPTRPKAEIPKAHFTDITRSAGITFTHNNGATG